MTGSVVTVLAAATLSLPGAAQGQLVATGLSCEFAVSLINPTPTACLGAYEGNDANQIDEILAQIALAAPDGFGLGDAEYLGTTDEGQSDGPFSSVPGGGSGTLVLDSPLFGDYVLALKSSNSFSLYLIAFNGETDIFYSTVGTSVNNKGNNQGLSHASLFGGAVSVPEPESFALLVTGLLGLGFVARRRRDQVV